MQQRPHLNRPSAFKIGKQTFVSGLHWALLPSKMKRSESLKREAETMKKNGGPIFEIAAVRGVGGKGGALQAGLSARSGNVRSGAYAAAAVVADVLGADFVAAISVDERAAQFLLVAVREGAILPMQDVLLAREDAKQRFLELVAAMPGDAVRLACPDAFAMPGSEEWSFEKVLQSIGVNKLTSSHKLAPLTVGMALRDRLPLILTATVVLAGMWGWTAYESYQKAKEEERLAMEAAAEAERLRLAQANAAQPIRELSRPWVGQPLPGEFVGACGSVMSALPLALDGWEFTSASCDGLAVTTVYTRVAPATVDAASHSASLFGLPTPAFDDLGNVATMTLPLRPIRPGGEDAIGPRDAIRQRFMTLAQGLEATFTLQDVPDPPVPAAPTDPGLEPPPPPPPPPWMTMRFDLQMQERIEAAAPALLTIPGVRITNINLARAGSTLSYTTTGELHAQR